MTAAKKVNFRFGDIVQLETTALVSSVGPGLPPGTAVPKGSYRVQLVGVLPGLSLLVTSPDVRGLPVLLNEGESFQVRIFNGDDALAFVSSVIRCCDQPYPYVHLSYPERFEQVQVRGARRTRLQLPAQVNSLTRAGGDEMFVGEDRLGPASAGVIRDLSVAGAQLESVTPLGPVGSHLVLTTQLAFDRVARRDVVLPAEIRNRRELVADDGSLVYAYGVKFIELTAEADLALSAFVYRHLASQLLREPVA